MKLNLLRFLPLLNADNGTNGVGGNGGTDGGTSEKTFTQEDLNRIAAQEKRQGMSSILKALGFEKEEDAKAFVEKYREEENNKKDDLTKAKEDLTTANTAKQQAEAKVETLERKFRVVAAGVTPKSADDVVLLTSAKVTDGKTFDDALEEVKKAYPAFFGEDNNAGGTGGNMNGARRHSIEGQNGIGKRLAEQRKTSSESQKKQSYFSN